MLWTTTGLTFAIAFLLGITGTFILRRPVAPGHRSALYAFAVWWFAAATVLALVGLRGVLYLFGVTDPGSYVVLRNLLAVPLSVALPALLYYLIFIYTGRRSALPLLTIAYALFFGYTLYYFWLSDVQAVEATRWSVRTVGTTQAPGWMAALFGIALAGPILVAVFAYASLYPRVTLPEQRYRIAMVSSAFILWFLPLLVAFLLGWNDEDWFPLVYQSPGIVAALLIILAYRPPSLVQRRWRAASTATGGLS